MQKNYKTGLRDDFRTMDWIKIVGDLKVYTRQLEYFLQLARAIT